MTEEKVSGCEGCVHESKMKIIITNNLTPYAHPCSYCKRFPRIPIRPDNYVPIQNEKREVKND